MGTPRIKESDVIDSLARLDREARRYRRKRSTERFFSQLTSGSIPGIVALLTLAFLSRLLWPPLIHTLPLVPLWILGVACALLLRRERWLLPLWQAGALADLKSESRGTFMSLQESGNQDWSTGRTWPDVRLVVKFPWSSAAKWLIGAALVLAVLLLPDMSPASSQSRAVAAPVQKLENMVATLKEENLADESFLEEVEKALEELKDDVDKSLEAADWQELDGLREDLEKKALDSFRRLRETQDEFQALREALPKPRASKDGAWREMAERLARLGSQEAAEFLAQAADFSAKTGEGTNLSPENLKKLLADCRAGRFDFSGKELAYLESLLTIPWITPEQMQRLMKALEGLDLSKLQGWCEGMGFEALTPEEIERLLRMLKEGRFIFSEEDLENLKALCMGACAGCKMGAGICAGMLPGRGGINRGPGPAPLLGAGGTEKNFGEFEGNAFRGNLADPDVPLGYSYAPPDPGARLSDGMNDASGPALEFKAGNERITWHSRLLPRHNDVMKNYFKEGKGK
jgi:hypothetical protein